VIVICPKCKDTNPWIIEVRGVYDGALIWECRACRHRWPRFAENTPLYKRAMELLAQWRLIDSEGVG